MPIFTTMLTPPQSTCGRLTASIVHHQPSECRVTASETASRMADSQAWISLLSGKNPFPLVEPDFLTAESQGPFPDVNLQTPAGEAIFAGLGTFGHLPFGACLSPITANLPLGSEELAPGDTFDIGIIGMPFDTAVSFRPGARFGPSGIRHNSKRMSKFRGYNVPLGLNIYESGQKILDCGDIPVTAFDNTLALKQMEQGYHSLIHRGVHTKTTNQTTHTQPLHTVTGRLHPKLITLGGDHTLVLPVLRSLYTAYGPVSVIHFDSHLDSWNPGLYGEGEEASKTSAINHGTFFWHASNEGLIKGNGSSTHAGIRTRLAKASDYDDDRGSGFSMQEAHVIDDIGTAGIIANIRKAVEGNPV